MSSFPQQSVAEAATASTDPVERPAPGIAALLDGISPDRTHSVLDLASATQPALRVHSRFARWVRFAGVLDAGVCDTRKLAHLHEQPEPPYDLVFAWDVLDRVFPNERSFLIRRLAEASASNARLHVLVDVSERAGSLPTRFSLVDVGRIRCEPLRSPGPPRERLLPAEVEHLLKPFEVVRGFVLGPSLREYVAVLHRSSRRRRASARGPRQR